MQSSVQGTPPARFCCPITLELMKDPVMAKDGRTYERTAIQKWFNARRPVYKSPMTNVRLSSSEVIDNNDLRSEIKEWLQRKPECVATAANTTSTPLQSGDVVGAQFLLRYKATYTKNYFPAKIIRCGCSVVALEYLDETVGEYTVPLTNVIHPHTDVPEDKRCKQFLLLAASVSANTGTHNETTTAQPVAAPSAAVPPAAVPPAAAPPAAVPPAVVPPVPVAPLEPLSDQWKNTAKAFLYQPMQQKLLCESLPTVLRRLHEYGTRIAPRLAAPIRTRCVAHLDIANEERLATMQYTQKLLLLDTIRRTLLDELNDVPPPNDDGFNFTFQTSLLAFDEYLHIANNTKHNRYSCELKKANDCILTKWSVQSRPDWDGGTIYKETKNGSYDNRLVIVRIYARCREPLHCLVTNPPKKHKTAFKKMHATLQSL